MQDIKDAFISAGLKPEAAEVYALLLENGKIGAGALLKKASMKRGLLYKTLHDLSAKKFVIEGRMNNKMCFSPADPDTVLGILDGEARALASRIELIREKMPELKAKFSVASERPVMQYFEGLQGLKKMYVDRLKYGDATHYFVRPGRVAFYSQHFGDWFQLHLKKVADAHITTLGITADDPETNHDVKRDKLRGFVRTWVREQDYTAPTEFYSYSNKVAVISFGKEIFGVLIENAPIAKGFQELFALAKLGAETLTITHDHK